MRTTLSDLGRKKKEGSKITVLTAYDAPFARMIDHVGIDIIVVNDGVVGAIALGRDEAFSTTIDEMIYHTRAVKTSTSKSLIVTSMTFGSYNEPRQAVINATRLTKEGLADAVHLEGDSSIRDSVKSIVNAGIPVVGHIGLTKQIIARTGQTRLQAKDSDGMLGIFNDAQILVDAGACALVLECVPESIAKIITNSFNVPIIGIGAGRYCDGQFLVAQDILGLYPGFDARFLKRYADLSAITVSALAEFKKDVETGVFPESKHTYKMKADELEMALKRMR
ncbi:MAG: 3-methyl-2-oxobutanoate hydroxymethyltransferase [Parcubacteria group bacterium GW2011_GWA2_43_17]|nr:MAG: 3-methyl-2-oxobutanoate hydroxymethyltransferase [Parcubacteria group bacterium GW2011_GWA2_43_17]OHB42829.1 MAG: 3-methyl-2-oxobutanoate hydroxymethyltransferase [Planctomycetes bacterium GWC2_45_44]